MFLDAPYLDTGLSVCYDDSEYYEVKGHNFPPYSSLVYEASGIAPEKLGKFAEQLGAKTKLWANDQIIPDGHPEWSHLGQGTGNWTEHGIDQDYVIPEFHILLNAPSIAKSGLIWRTMLSVPVSHLKAHFRWNQKQKLLKKDSSLVYDLKDSEWVPQEDGDSISFVRPREASRYHLPTHGFLWPKGYPNDAGEEWLKAIQFDEIVAVQKEEHAQHNQHAIEFGFDSADEAKKAAAYFEKMGISVGESLKKLLTQERRKELLIIDLSDAEEKSYEVLARSIKVSGSAIDPRTALRVQYTMDENRMHCQMCSKGMPFKKRNSDEDYFESVEALGKGYFFKEHEAQYLALCPQCAAEYKEFVKRDPKTREAFHDALKNSDSPQIHVESNGRTIRIWFEDKHWQDLKTVLYYYENVYDPENSDD